MPRARPLLFVILALCGAGCGTPSESRARASGSFFQMPGEDESAFVTFVAVERPLGHDDINRHVWSTVDEQLVPFETRRLLEEAGLRVGIATLDGPGPLRRMVDDPRSKRGHRGRALPIERPSPLFVGGLRPWAEFEAPGPDGTKVAYGREHSTLGFEITVRPAGTARTHVRLVPMAQYREPTRLLPGADGLRDTSSETFPAAGFEVTLGGGEYLVVGTESHREGTFGHAALTERDDGRRVQRLMVLGAHARAAAAEGFASVEGEPPPLVAQVARP